MRVCRECGEEKFLSEFHKKSEAASGLRNRCKLCRNAKAKEYRKRPYVKKLNRESVKRWRDSEKGQVSIKKYKKEYNQRESTKALNRKYSRQHRARYPNRIISRKRLWWAVEAGKLIRPENCSLCHRKCKPHGHHHNGHGPEHWLDVVWLCHSCHALEHRKAI